MSLRAALVALAVAAVGFPLGMAIGGSERQDTVAGAFLLSAIAGLIAAPWIVRAWQGYMRRQMIAAAVAGRPDVQHIDGERERDASERALASPAFTLGAFRNSGLVEPFVSAGVHHILAGEAGGVPFAVAELALLDTKGYRVFGGVLASFRLARARSGLTIVLRDHGILGNLVARVGAGLDPLPLEDPSFEHVFEVYGTDQVAGRVILTTTMLERLVALDRMAHARGFACAFVDDHLLIALRGMSWRCPWWRILRPVDSWLGGYAAWLSGLVDLPVGIVQTLNLATPPERSPALAATSGASSVAVGGGDGQVFSSPLWRLVGEGGMAMTYVASGSVFGGLAAFAAWYGFKQGFPASLFWYLWGLSAAGLAYGIYAVSIGLGEIGRLAWRWNAPLRTLKRR